MFKFALVFLFSNECTLLPEIIKRNSKIILSYKQEKKQKEQPEKCLIQRLMINHTVNQTKNDRD